MSTCICVDEGARIGMSARPIVLNGVHVEHRLAMHKGFTYHAAIWLAW